MPHDMPFSSHISRLFAAVLGAPGLLACGLLAAVLYGCSTPARSVAPGYELVGEDLEPFRSAFNAASDDVRAVLLVGPT